MILERHPLPAKFSRVPLCFPTKLMGTAKLGWQRRSLSHGVRSEFYRPFRNLAITEQRRK